MTTKEERLSVCCRVWSDLAEDFLNMLEDACEVLESQGMKSTSRLFSEVAYRKIRVAEERIKAEMERSEP